MKYARRVFQIVNLAEMVQPAIPVEFKITEKSILNPNFASVKSTIITSRVKQSVQGVTTNAQLVQFWGHVLLVMPLNSENSV
jgi:hypothetical protein